MFFEHIGLEREFVFKPKVGTFTEHEMHMHDALEISVLQDVGCLYRTPKRDYEGKPGDVFIFRPFEPHWNLVKAENRPYRWTMVLFSPSVVRGIPDGYKLLAPFYAADLHSPLIPADSPYAAAIQARAAEALEEERLRQPGWRTSQWLHFVDILLNIYRYYFDATGEGGGREAAMEGGQSIVAAVEHLLAHYTDAIDMEALIAGTGLGRTRFYRLFRQVASVSPNTFVNRLRLQHSLALLARPELTITDIAFECGFQSLSYFNKQFKKLHGVTPGERRQQLLGEGVAASAAAARRQR